MYEFYFGCKLDVCAGERQVCSQVFRWALTWGSGCKLDALAAAAILMAAAAILMAAAAKLMAAAANLTPICPCFELRLQRILVTRPIQ